MLAYLGVENSERARISIGRTYTEEFYGRKKDIEDIKDVKDIKDIQYINKKCLTLTLNQRIDDRDITFLVYTTTDESI
jgi:hypothetical protein